MPKFIVIRGPLKDQIFEFGNGTVFFGRHPRMNDISILDITVSRKHLKIFKIGKDIFLEDLKSKHGTMLNGKLIEPGEGFPIKEGDLITIGKTVMRLTETSGKGSLRSMSLIPQKIKREPTSKEPYNREKRSTKEIELVCKISELFRKQMNIHKFFEEVLKLLLEALPRIDSARIFLLRNDKEPFMEVIEQSHEKSVVKYSRKVLEKVIQECKTVRMSNTNFESPNDYRDRGDTLKIGSVLCVPIVGGNEILGAIYIDSRESYSFRKEDQLLLYSLAGPMAVAIEKDRLASNSRSD